MQDLDFKPLDNDTPFNYQYTGLTEEDALKLSKKNFKLCCQRHSGLPEKSFVSKSGAFMKIALKKFDFKFKSKDELIKESLKDNEPPNLVSLVCRKAIGFDHNTKFNQKDYDDILKCSFFEKDEELQPSAAILEFKFKVTEDSKMISICTLSFYK